MYFCGFFLSSVCMYIVGGVWTLESVLSFHNVDLGSTSLATCTFTHWTILQALEFLLYENYIYLTRLSIFHALMSLKLDMVYIADVCINIAMCV